MIRSLELMFDEEILKAFGFFIHEIKKHQTEQSNRRMSQSKGEK